MRYTFFFTITPGLPSGVQSCFPPTFAVPSDDPAGPPEFLEVGAAPLKTKSELHVRAEKADEETNEAFDVRISREVDRELLRIGVLSTKRYEKKLTDIRPVLSRKKDVAARGGYALYPVDVRRLGKPQTWSDGLEVKVKLWSEAFENRNNLLLVYAYLNMICEVDSVPKWEHDSAALPSPEQEIVLIRNLLLHSGTNPISRSVLAYCQNNGLVATRNPAGIESHKKHARDRLRDLFVALWKGLLSELGVRSIEP